MSDSDEVLVARTLQGDSHAFGVLVERYQDAAYGIALHVLGEPGQALEVAQDAFLRAYARLCQLKDPNRFAGWVCRIAMNLARNLLAKSRLNHARARLKKEVVKMADKVLKRGKPEADFWRSATATMSGRVTSAATGLPVEGASLELYEVQTLSEVRAGWRLGGQRHYSRCVFDTRESPGVRRPILPR